MISVLEAQKKIGEHAAALTPEAVPLARAPGRVLREPVASAEDLPPFDRSAMDGYAIRLDDDAKQFEVIGEIRAGQSVDRQLQPGEAMRILTGARLPGPGLKVVMQEDTELSGTRLLITKRSDATHVRKRGEDARAGEILVQPGRMLDATALAVLTSVGKAEPLVSPIPRILHITTGDEIVPPEATPGEGQIRNSNASLIAGLCRERGVDAIEHRHVADDLAEMVRTLREAGPENFDVVLISGGSGGGTYDFSAELFKTLNATIHFRSVNVRPGKPLIFGTSPGQIVFGLPGNAMSHYVCFHLFVRPALEGLLGRPESTTQKGFLAESMADTKNARETWWPAQAVLREGRLECRALAWKSSGDITRLPSANALIHVPASTSQLDAGTMVELLFTRDLTIR
jgi:molybdopterin molybdotransferase